MKDSENLREDETKNLFSELKEIFSQSIVKYQKVMEESFSGYQKKISEIEETRKNKIEEALNLLTPKKEVLGGR